MFPPERYTNNPPDGGKQISEKTMEISREGQFYLESRWVGDVIPAAAQAAAKLAADGASEEECIIAAEKVVAPARKATNILLSALYPEEDQQ